MERKRVGIPGGRPGQKHKLSGWKERSMQERECLEQGRGADSGGPHRPDERPLFLTRLCTISHSNPCSLLVHAHSITCNPKGRQEPQERPVSPDIMANGNEVHPCWGRATFVPIEVLREAGRNRPDV